MSLTLDQGTFPSVTVKTYPYDGSPIFFGDQRVDMQEFCELVKVALTPEWDLLASDTMVYLCFMIVTMKVVDGYNADTKRLIVQVGGVKNSFKNRMSARIVMKGYAITYEDFCVLVEYVLTNTDLWEERDPRLQLVEDVRMMKIKLSL